MKLIDVLAAGIVGAENGFARLVKRGTSTRANYYGDFEASEPEIGATDIPLDEYGSTVVYVNELVEVTALDENGVEVRSFVAGENASSVEVISPSFSGVNYESGQAGTSLPTTLQRVLDAWIVSAGAPDFNVDVGGVQFKLDAAIASLSGLFFNVKTYGAVGDGISDDGTFIQAAIDAARATAAFGGIVFFPPGYYRTTIALNVPPGVSILGCAQATRLWFDSSGLSNCMVWSGSDFGSRSVQGIWFGKTSTADAAPLCYVTGSGACVDFMGCAFGADVYTTGLHLTVDATAAARVTVTRCSFYQAASNGIISKTGSGRIHVVDSDLIVDTATYTARLVDVDDGLSVDRCNFDASAVTSGVATYVAFAPSTWGNVVVANSHFAPSGGGAIALYNSLAVPIYDAIEYGNTFGTPADHSLADITPYSYVASTYAHAVTFRFGPVHGSRGVEAFVADNTVTTIAANANNMRQTIISKTSGTTLNILANPGAAGDEWLLELSSNGAGSVVVTPIGGIALNGNASTVTVSTNNSVFLKFAWLPDPTNDGFGKWYQISPTATTN